MSDDYKWDFFVSYVSNDRRWGEWITQVLQTAHYRVTSVDYAQGGEEAFLYALQYSCRLLPVLSPVSTDGTYEEIAWQNECVTRLANHARSVIPIMVTPCDPAGWLRIVTPIDLTNSAIDQAAELLLRGIKAAVTGERRLPHEPPFPG